MRRVRTVVVLVMLSAASAQAEPCPAGTAPRLQVDLYFGRNIGEIVGVSEDAWAKFLDEEITPRFPDGLSIMDVSGRWKDPASGRIVREPGKRLTVLVDMTVAQRTAITEIIAAYKARHDQKSVLMTETPVCAAD